VDKATSPVPSGDTDFDAGSVDLYLLDELLTDEERDIRKRVRDFGNGQVLPIINHFWEQEEFPSHLVPKIAELRVAGGSISGYGCPGMTPVAEGLVASELARADGSVRVFFIAHSLAMSSIAALGSEQQREQWLPALARLESVGGFALTERAHGSDVAGLETRAHRNGDHYILEGSKHWCGNGTIADLIVVWARDDEGNVGAFLLETPAKDLVVQAITGKAACRAAAHGDISLDRVRIPAQNRLPAARTFRDAARILARSRQSVAWEAMGHALGAYEIALNHVLEREQFGRPLAAFQLIQEKLARMLVDITSMQLMCWRVSRLEEVNKATQAMSSAAKMYAAATARRAVLDARDILGGDGVLLRNHVVRHHLDMEAVYTYEGTHAINAMIIGRDITGYSAFGKLE
jgi:glutaryl-CoA dehydrogenase